MVMALRNDLQTSKHDTKLVSRGDSSSFCYVRLCGLHLENRVHVRSCLQLHGIFDFCSVAN